MNAPVGIFTSSPGGRIMSVNQTLASMLGYETPRELIESITDIGQEIYANPGDREYLKKVLGEYGEIQNLQCQWGSRTGGVFWVSMHAKASRNEKGKIDFIQGFATDITERKQAEEALRESEATYRALFENSLDAIFLTVPDGRVLAANKAACEMMGMTESEIIAGGRDGVVDETDPRLSEALKQRALNGNFKGELNFKRKDGTRFPVEISTGIYQDRLGNERTCIIARDITERRQAEAEHESLQQQLLQSQKMESVGRLAGGIAHEFNNMLSIINGYAEMMADVLSPTEPMYDNARKIGDAGKRSAVIIRKLLAFARKQAITPEVMNLNDSISSMLKMLEKTIGENIDLFWKPEKNAWLIKMDFSQLDQILINLVVNARDAFYEGGEVIIETKNVEFDKEYCGGHPGFVPGQYVMLAVSDNGCGMSKEVQSHLFEPFFTTKEMGRGTGLGLPTVYGIAKQNNGFVNVYSEPGEGTSFKVYFLRHKEGDAVDSSADEEKSPVKGNGETILILEDEEEVLGIARLMLEKLGYKVLTAETPNKAMALAEAHLNQIDLLITDIVMPEMNGRDFANQLKELYPDVKILFMSGYTDNVIAHHNMESEDLLFIEKPFTLKDISLKVREALLS
ncbi:PAS domain S-box-containing protein [Desulfosalsimonas propionicica]|uniref:histidine kinase n=2 Tax=Desulfosalsimonas propionicica TaxID=332175 RepID=A0A7W0CAF4_9BACT|nr:PAS domain S-box-containing protein [Desulfosalsimonas propionicica]